MTMTDAEVVGTEVAPIPTSDPRHPLHLELPSPEAARHAMEVYQQISHALLNDNDVQVIKTRRGESSFPKRSAFQKLANAYRVSTEIVKRELTHDDEGKLIRCDVIVRATHPDGRYSEGDGACSASEDRFARNSDKIDHDLPATAVTRAKNRAISDLVAFGAVSAEEAESGGIAEGSGGQGFPTWALPMNDIPGVAENLVAILKAAGVALPGDAAAEIGNTVFKQADGSFPFIAARVVNLLYQAIGPNLLTDEERERSEEPDIPGGVQDEPNPDQTSIDDQTNTNE